MWASGMEPRVHSMQVHEVVPFLIVESMGRSIAFYVDGLGFQLEQEWRPAGDLRWCQLRQDGARIMLQVGETEGRRAEFYFMCEDAVAVYRALVERGVAAREPFVGNHMWVTSMSDPDGNAVHYESVTDVPEETRLSELEERP